MSSMRGKTLVKGHTLRYEGAPFNANGQRDYSTVDQGRAKCSCGALSDVLPNTASRKRWHREHKAEVSS